MGLPRQSKRLGRANIAKAVGCAVGHNHAEVKQKQANQADPKNQTNAH
jgi:hypothetical protein